MPRRTLSIAAAQPGWRAIIQAHGGRGARVPGETVNGGYRLFRDLDRETIDSLPTAELGEVHHVVAWALIEEWQEEIPEGYESRGIPADDAYGFGQFVDPVTADHQELEIGNWGLVRLVAPGEPLGDEEIRACLLGAIHRRLALDAVNALDALDED